MNFQENKHKHQFVSFDFHHLSDKFAFVDSCFHQKNIQHNNHLFFEKSDTKLFFLTRRFVWLPNLNIHDWLRHFLDVERTHSHIRQKPLSSFDYLNKARCHNDQIDDDYQQIEIEHKN